MYSIEKHLRWTLKGKREEKKCKRKEKRPWPKKVDLWFLVLCTLYCTSSIIRLKMPEVFHCLACHMCGGVETPNTQKKKLCLLGGSTRAKASFET